MPSKELVAASTRPLILALLRSGESYGYEIIERVRGLSRGTLEWSDGMLYPVLRRLERDGLVGSRWVKADNGRPRRYYHLTDLGIEAEASGRSEWRRVDGALKAAWRQASEP